MWLRRKLASVWEALCDAGAVLYPCRFSLFVIVAGAALLLLTAQGQELAVRLPDEPLFWRELAFHACVFLWGFESWYWARIMLDFTFSRDRQSDVHGRLLSSRQQWLVNHLPRILAAAAYLIAGFALLLARSWIDLAATAAIGIGFYSGLVLRLAFTEGLRRILPGALREYASSWFGQPGLRPASIQDLPPVSRGVLYLSLVLAGICTALVLIDAVAFGWALGAAAVPFLGLALIVPVGSLFVYWSRVGGPPGTRHVSSYPAVTMLVIWALIVEVGFDRLADNHVVRVARDERPPARLDLAEAAARWHAAATAAWGSEDPPLVIVATSGGGLRAAYWTATVLGALQDADPDFSRYVFGISGVSGGSLGAAVFVTLLAEADELDISRICATDGRSRGMIECAGQAVLAQDFLAPVGAALLFPDLMQKFLPIFPNGRDRAAALERSWERAWGRAGLSQNAWADRNFTSLWSAAGAGAPALLLNGTYVESGKRIITSNLRIQQSVFNDAYDVFDDLIHVDVPISTAALNSARFPYLCPAGTLRTRGKLDRHGHIVDGGYFEDSGAVTARELLRGVLQELAREGRKARPVLIQISDDPELKPDDLDLSETARLAPRASNGWGNEALSPLRALLNAHRGRGTLAYKQFLREAPDERRAHFRLCPVAGEPPPALGWVLSRASMEQMRRLVRDDTCENRRTFARVLAAINRTSAPAH
ncbi:MAG TPA: patatin-like phospholipase family protein [Burkholderiaceae bacterium]|nr:patatin-like phospholipase family protein [Burkholderiaceae bacterium]